MRVRRRDNLRYRAQQFNNRNRPTGWLRPSIDTTMPGNGRAPGSGIGVLRYANAAKSVHQRRRLSAGLLADYEVREYPLGKFGHICANYDTTVDPLQIEHIHARAVGGSNHVSNLPLACRLCTSYKAARNIRGFLANTPARLTRILL